MAKFRITRGWVYLSDDVISIDTSNLHVLKYAYEQSILYFAFYVTAVALLLSIVFGLLSLLIYSVIIFQGDFRWAYTALVVGLLALLFTGPGIYRKYFTNISAADTIPLHTVTGVVYRREAGLSNRPTIIIAFDFDEETESWKRRVLKMSLIGIDSTGTVEQMRDTFENNGIPVLSEDEFESRKAAIQAEGDEVTPPAVFSGLS